MYWELIIPLGLVGLAMYFAFGYVIGYGYWYVHHHSWGSLGPWWRRLTFLLLFPGVGWDAYTEQYINKRDDWQQKLNYQYELMYCLREPFPEDTCRVMAVIWPLGIVWSLCWLTVGLFFITFMTACCVSLGPVVGIFFGLYKIGTWPVRRMFGHMAT
ncbi:MAG: hypothetical protein CO029_02015 [Candidatus Magasanikbacteria bacterium CG_4_9_14_0_2_um_filter_41_10]|uniref:Uncharacterized protein n=1 Tax=Candidatus Magasanikbacteria bacterium CG_4_10_14_0_2_um_filter_41_31 TaxID=1974639 RepID=A0A2M7V3J1_9BACT|nr:MAG: hypothetical protein AUJ37_01585 [Candidatus Magasanikbacteria bacterium CG1_02_41_34]PIZ93053.1 MAG: hypothetical protein COX83_02890 [Candidatus Magasanikbacteria bacterium CG_4_10_14_0_2_um_filter_41_31]PJC53590.1 MAG: hypothetical protein CO029_02015 [Candidatus Magasanikbacteria bacterium CG_4_9_14_0_2_um_filter_41_10]